MLQTILCAACMPEPCAGTFPEMSLTVVTADPILPSPGGDSDSHVPRFRLVPVSELPVRPRPSPPPELIAKRTRTGPLTFEELCEMEPRLQLLLAAAEAHHKNREPVFCANAVWYGYPGFRPGIKDRLCKLAGWLAERAGDLNSPEAYDLAYQTLYSALPDCRGRCICTRILEI
jgi:hypothetical protein